jgi:hypothetical protein
MLAQVDLDGYSLTMLKGIMDYKRDDAVAILNSNMHVVTNRGHKKLRKTTIGWNLPVKWADESESWIALKDMKEAHPIKVAKFSKVRDITNKPAFTWWVLYTLCKWDVILSKIKAQIRKTTHKCGIKTPLNIDYANRLDKENGNTLWRDALAKEMTEAGIAFEVLPDGQVAPPAWKKVTGHLVWDVKMDFTRKARWVLDGHKTPNPPIGSMYAGVVSQDSSMRIAFTYAALNGQNVCAVDIRNAYLQAPSSCKDYIICRPEFGL